jgi:hypothetical protein
MTVRTLGVALFKLNQRELGMWWSARSSPTPTPMTRAEEVAKLVITAQVIALEPGADPVYRHWRSRASVTVAGRLVAGTAREATPGDRAGRFHGDRSHARRGASLTSRRRIGSIEKARFQGFFRSRPVSRILFW